MREVLLWPAGKEAQADAYLDKADAAYAALTGNPGDLFYARDRFDKRGQRVTGYYGPTGMEWNGTGIAEPAACLAARADAVLATSVDWPEEE